MHENDLALSPRLAKAVILAESQARSLACVGWEGHVRGIFVLSEEIRPDALSAVARCREMGLHLCLLTGDHPRRAKALADQLGIDVEAELLPGDKLNAIARLREKWRAVAMVGDGINDSPALVAADVGIAMGCGADVSRQSAGVCLLGNQLDRVPDTIELGKYRADHSTESLLVVLLQYGRHRLGVLGLAEPDLGRGGHGREQRAGNRQFVAIARRIASRPEEPFTPGTEATNSGKQSSESEKLRGRHHRIAGPCHGRRGRSSWHDRPADDIRRRFARLGALRGNVRADRTDRRRPGAELAKNLRRQLVYSSGRIFTYATVGAVAGYAGMALAGRMSAVVNMQAVLALVAGGMLIVQGLLSAGVISWPRHRRLPACLAPGLISAFMWRRAVERARFWPVSLPAFCRVDWCTPTWRRRPARGAPRQASRTWPPLAAGTAPLLVAVGTGGSLLGLTTRQRAVRVAACFVIAMGVVSLTARGRVHRLAGRRIGRRLPHVSIAEGR